MDETLDKLLKTVCKGDLMRYSRAIVLAAVLEHWPDIPSEVLDRVTCTPGQGHDDVQTNAGMVVSAWLNKAA